MPQGRDHAVTGQIVRVENPEFVIGEASVGGRDSVVPLAADPTGYAQGVFSSPAAASER